MKKSIIQLVLLFVMALGFFSITPWLGCRSLSEISDINIPKDAVCFTDNHGVIAFHKHGLISKEPIRFVFHLLIMAIPFYFLIRSFKKP